MISFAKSKYLILCIICLSTSTPINFSSTFLLLIFFIVSFIFIIFLPAINFFKSYSFSTPLIVSVNDVDEVIRQILPNEIPEKLRESLFKKMSIMKYAKKLSKNYIAWNVKIIKAIYME